MSVGKAREVRFWLSTNPGLDELRHEYPAEWARVERELNELVDTGDRAALTAYVRQLAKPPAAASRPTISGLTPRLAAQVRRQMAAEAIKSLSIRAATGVHSGHVRFGRLNGTIAQRLLFRRGLERKPVSMTAFRLLWPLLSQRRRLMALVQPQGIYCFYSAALIDELGALIDGRSCLEIAAGDGTLSRFLNEAGTKVTATDNYSWAAVTISDDVHRLDAAAALRTYRPEVVLCSWPPAHNSFEAAVFATKTVQTYIVIGNRMAAGWGNHDAYQQQRAFTLDVSERLSALVLPPELESVVCVFERQSGC